MTGEQWRAVVHGPDTDVDESAAAIRRGQESSAELEQLRVAHAETVRGIASQEAAVAELRQRAGTVIAATGLVTSFLGADAIGSGLDTGAKVIAAGAFVISVGGSIVVLLPIYVWRFRIVGTTLIDDWIDQHHVEGLVGMYRWLIKFLERNITTNQQTLGRLQAAFVMSAIALALEIAALAWAISERRLVT